MKLNFKGRHFGVLPKVSSGSSGKILYFFVFYQLKVCILYSKLQDFDHFQLVDDVLEWLERLTFATQNGLYVSSILSGDIGI